MDVASFAHLLRFSQFTPAPFPQPAQPFDQGMVQSSAVAGRSCCSCSNEKKGFRLKGC